MLISGSRRCQILMLLMLTFLYQTCRVGEEEVLLLYTQQLGITRSTYAYLLGTGYFFQGLFLVTVLPVYTNLIEVPGLKMVAAGFVAKASGLTILAFSHRTWHLFVGIFIGTFNSVFVNVSQSQLRKLVTPQEIGEVFGLVNSLETISSISGSGIFIYMYSFTSDVFHGLTFLIMAGIVISMAGVICVLYKINVRDLRHEIDVEPLSGQRQL